MTTTFAPFGESVIKVDHVLIQHADATGRYSLPNARRLRRPTNEIERILSIFEEVQRTGAERILCSAVHAFSPRLIASRFTAWPSDAQDATLRHPAHLTHGLLPSAAEKVRPSTSVSCMYFAPANVPEAGTGSVTVAAAPILARIPKGPGSNLL
jgi:hypothetical protein